jgi:hypothetical protein
VIHRAAWFILRIGFGQGTVFSQKCSSKAGCFMP